MAIQLAKVKTFQVIDMNFIDNIHIQNCTSCTRVVFNPICAEATTHMNRMVDNIETPSPYALTQIPAQPTVAPLEEFLCNTQRDIKATIFSHKSVAWEIIFVFSHHCIQHRPSTPLKSCNLVLDDWGRKLEVREIIWLSFINAK